MRCDVFGRRRDVMRCAFDVTPCDAMRVRCNASAMLYLIIFIVIFLMVIILVVTIIIACAKPSHFYATRVVAELLSYRPLVLPLFTMWKFALVCLCLASVADGMYAFGSLWMLDLRGASTWPGSELFSVYLEYYGRNLFTLISSDPSQWWFRVDAVYVDNPAEVEDVSDVYRKNLRGHRTLKFIGYFSFFLIMAKLLPMFRLGMISWHEMIVHSNDYGGEVGCTVNVRSSMQPWVWFLRVGAETSIKAGKLMFQNFKQIKLPRLIICNEWNYASWRPYCQASGPVYFVYTPHKTLDFKSCLEAMAIEEEFMADDDDAHSISDDLKKTILKAYDNKWEEGPWLTKMQKERLSLCRVAKL